MAAIFDNEAYKVETVNAFGGGEEPWVCWEAVITARTKEGEFLIPTFLFLFFKHCLLSFPYRALLSSFLEEEGE